MAFWIADIYSLKLTTQSVQVNAHNLQHPSLLYVNSVIYIYLPPTTKRSFYQVKIQT